MFLFAALACAPAAQAAEFPPITPIAGTLGPTTPAIQVAPALAPSRGGSNGAPGARTVLALHARGARRRGGWVLGAASRACPDANLMPAPGNLGRVESATLCLINLQRARAGLAPLSDQPNLEQAARAHSQDMTARRYFDHVSPGGGSLLSRLFGAGYLRSGVSYSVGENIAWGSGQAGTPASAVNLWMGSPDHRANILRAQYRQSGVGISPAVPARSGGRGATYTEDFGTRS